MGGGNIASCRRSLSRMSFLFTLKRHFQRRLPRPLQRKLQQTIYVVLYRLSPARHQNFFNSGYAPVSEWLKTCPPFDREPLQATLYDRVLDGWADASGASPRSILDIGCGLGGGMRVAAHRFPGSSIVGLDVNATAAQVARRRLRELDGARVEIGNALSQPFEDGRFDLVFSVGAAGYVGLKPFMKEATRVLAPGGVLSFSAGYTDAGFEEHRLMVQAEAGKLGLELVEVTDITANVFAAIDADVPRRRALIDRVPWPFRGYALAWADMPGSMRYQEYVDGRRLDYLVVCRKPEA